MRTSDFSFSLPAEQIAQQPAADRSGSRLLHLRGDGTTAHHRFSDLPDLLRPDDLLVRNDTRVFPARLRVRKQPTGGRVELLALPGSISGAPHFEALARPALSPGIRLVAGEVRLQVEARAGARHRIRIVEGAADVFRLADRLGETPLPPYIRRPAGALPEDRARYQTVYARRTGSVAAPTAGLHFSEESFRRLAARGIAIHDLTLHVGYGTFAPVRSKDPRQHRLEPEWYRLPDSTRRAVAAALRERRRVVAVGTTTVRVLETLGGNPEAPPESGFADLLILPGHRFRLVDALLTNFHLPESSLIMLVAALAGRKRVLAAYREAVRKRYRFHSFGDAMLVERPGDAG